MSFTFPPPNASIPARPSVMGVFDLPDLDEAETSGITPREIITTPATPVQHDTQLAQDDGEEQAIARLSAFSFGSKSQRPVMPLRDPFAQTARPGGFPSRPPPFPLDLSGVSSRESMSKSRPSSPSRKRHQHNRSESISLPNLKLGGRPTSLGLPSPGFTSAPNSPFMDGSKSNRLSTPLHSGSRLKFEPSDKEREESRRRAFDKLTGGSPQFEQPKHAEISLPAFDDDEISTTSSRPPSSTTITSIASSSRPNSLAATTSGSFNGSATSPLPWSTFEDSDRWSFPHRFDPNKDEVGIGFDLPPAPKTSSVLLNSGLGVLAEEDETESDRETADEMPESTSSVQSPEDLTPVSLPTPSKLRELHLVTGGSRRGSNPEVKERFTRDSPTKAFGSFGRNRPRPLGLDEASAFIAGSTSPVNRVGRSNSLNSSLNGRRPSSRGSSISYKKDDAGSSSSRDFVTSPPGTTSDIASPTYTSPSQELPTRSLSRPCPRPRSILGLGAAGHTLVEVDEEEEDTSALGFREDGVTHGRLSFESSRDSIDSSAWTRRDSRDRIDAEMERDALREDVELWRKRCRGMEDKLEAERRESSRLRERVRKLGDRIIQASQAPAPSPSEEREMAQSRLITEMREQLFSLASALERERKDKAEALARNAELQVLVDGARTPHMSPASLPTTPKSRPRPTIMTAPPVPEIQYEPVQDAYEDADNFADADDEHLGPNDDPNLNRMRGWGFPQGPVDRGGRENKRDSFFGLSRARPVRAPKASGSGLGLAWPAQEDEHYDLPPIVVNEATESLITPVSPSHATFNATSRVVSDPIRKNPFQTPEKPERPPLASSGSSGFGLSFLSGYLTLPRSTPAPPPIPRISITPSSVSPKKGFLHLERDSLNAPIGSVARGCEIDFRHCCHSCNGEIIEL